MLSLGIHIGMGGGPVMTTPLTILSAGGLPLIWMRSDLGITLGADPTFTAPNDFTNGAWTKTGSSATTATMIAETAANSVHTVAQTPANISSNVPTIQTVDVWPGSGSIDRGHIYLEGNGGTSRVFFNYLTGTVGTQTGATGSILSLGGGQYRCTMNYTRTSAGWMCGLSTDGATISYAGDTNSDVMLANPTLTQSRVSAIADQTGNGHNFSQATPASFPAYNTSSLNLMPGIAFDGTSHFLDNTTDVYPAPGTAPTFHWMVFRQLAAPTGWTNGDPILSSITAATFRQEIFQGATTPRIRCFNGSSGTENAGGTIGSARRLEAYFNNATSDYLKIGATSVTGVNTGNQAGGGGSRFGGDSGALRGNFELFEYVRLRRLPSAGELTALDAYVTATYGVGLV